MRIVLNVVGVLLLGLGLVFVLGHQGLVGRLVVGGVLVAAGVALFAVARLSPPAGRRAIVQKIEVSGDVRLEDMTCRKCQGTLNKESVVVKAGAVFVSCPYCDASYQIEEAPKW